MQFGIGLAGLAGVQGLRLPHVERQMRFRRRVEIDTGLAFEFDGPCRATRCTCIPGAKNIPETRLSGRRGCLATRLSGDEVCPDHDTYRYPSKSSIRLCRPAAQGHDKRVATAVVG